MIYDLLKTAIEQENMFMTKDLLKLQTEFFFEKGKINELERAKLISLLEGQETPAP